jgi:hypothetical protein
MNILLIIKFTVDTIFVLKLIINIGYLDFETFSGIH